MKLIALLLTVTIGLAMNEKTVILSKRNPTPATIKALESKLASYLAEHHPALAKKHIDYYRQYGENDKNTEKVRANFMCQVDGDRWKREWITTLDGGDCYFSFYYDPKKSEIIDFHKNGES